MMESFPWIFGVILTILCVVSVAILCLYFVRTRISAERIKRSHDVAGFAYGVIGVVYAVLLGFTVVNVQERFNEARHIAELEANYVADLYRDAEVLGDPYAKEIQEILRRYIDSVLAEEWALMSEGKTADSVIRAVHDLWYAYYKVEPKSEREKIWLTESIAKLNDFTNIRLNRVYNSNDSLSVIMWVLLYAGAAITIGFLGFFWIEDFRIHLFITIALSALIALTLYLIQALDSVYFGDYSVEPSALIKVRDFLKKWY